MKKVVQYVFLLALGVLAAVKYKITLIVIASLIVLLIIGVIFSNWNYIWKTKRFFREYDGQYFLWYSSKKRLKEKIETHLIPLLSDMELSIIYNNQNTVESSLDEFALRMVRNKIHNTKFPILFKVENGRLNSETFYDEIHQIRFEGLPVSEFDEKVISKLKKLTK